MADETVSPPPSSDGGGRSGGVGQPVTPGQPPTSSTPRPTVAATPAAPKVSPPVVGFGDNLFSDPGGDSTSAATVPADVFKTWSSFRATLGVGVPQRINRARAASKAMRDAVR